MAGEMMKEEEGEKREERKEEVEEKEKANVSGVPPTRQAGPKLCTTIWEQKSHPCSTTFSRKNATRPENP